MNVREQHGVESCRHREVESFGKAHPGAEYGCGREIQKAGQQMIMRHFPPDAAEANHKHGHHRNNGNQQQHGTDRGNRVKRRGKAKDHCDEARNPNGDGASDK